MLSVVLGGFSLPFVISFLSNSHFCVIFVCCFYNVSFRFRSRRRVFSQSDLSNLKKIFLNNM